MTSAGIAFAVSLAIMLIMRPPFCATFTPRATASTSFLLYLDSSPLLSSSQASFDRHMSPP